jgi:uncharacterized protein YlbG (UPF0298 family)
VLGHEMIFKRQKMGCIIYYLACEKRSKKYNIYIRTFELAENVPKLQERKFFKSLSNSIKKGNFTLFGRKLNKSRKGPLYPLLPESTDLFIKIVSVRYVYFYF